MDTIIYEQHIPGSMALDAAEWLRLGGVPEPMIYRLFEPGSSTVLYRASWWKHDRRRPMRGYFGLDSGAEVVATVKGNHCIQGGTLGLG